MIMIIHKILTLIMFTSFIGCMGAIKDMYQTDKYEKESIEKEKADKKAWKIFEVRMFSNNSGLPLTEQPDYSERYEIILAPLYFGDKSSSEQNLKVLDEWLKELSKDDDVYYLAYNLYSDSSNYNNSIISYNKLWKDINGKALNFEGEGYFDFPDKVIKDGIRKYDFLPMSGIIPRTQERYDLIISKGIAKINK